MTVTVSKYEDMPLNSPSKGAKWHTHEAYISNAKTPNRQTGAVDHFMKTSLSAVVKAYEKLVQQPRRADEFPKGDYVITVEMQNRIVGLPASAWRTVTIKLKIS